MQKLVVFLLVYEMGFLLVVVMKVVGTMGEVLVYRLVLL